MNKARLLKLIAIPSLIVGCAAPEVAPSGEATDAIRCRGVCVEGPDLSGRWEGEATAWDGAPVEVSAALASGGTTGSYEGVLTIGREEAYAEFHIDAATQDGVIALWGDDGIAVVDGEEVDEGLSVSVKGRLDEGPSLSARLKGSIVSLTDPRWGFDEPILFFDEPILFFDEPILFFGLEMEHVGD